MVKVLSAAGLNGFHAIDKSLEKTERIRILVGISTGRKVIDLIDQAKQESLPVSNLEAEEAFGSAVATELSNSDDKKEVEEGVQKFLEWLRSGKLEIRVYPAQNIHAKLYIMTFAEDDRDLGRVITGSSNFTQSGLVDNKGLVKCLGLVQFLVQFL